MSDIEMRIEMSDKDWLKYIREAHVVDGEMCLPEEEAIRLLDIADHVVGDDQARRRLNDQEAEAEELKVELEGLKVKLGVVEQHRDLAWKILDLLDIPAPAEQADVDEYQEEYHPTEQGE